MHRWADSVRVGLGPTGSITGIDASPQMLEQTRRRAERADWDNVALVALVAADATALTATALTAADLGAHYASGRRRRRRGGLDPAREVGVPTRWVGYRGSTVDRDDPWTGRARRRAHIQVRVGNSQLSPNRAEFMNDARRRCLQLGTAVLCDPGEFSLRPRSNRS